MSRELDEGALEAAAAALLNDGRGLVPPPFVVSLARSAVSAYLSALSAAPADDGLRAENERFRTALETIVKNYGTEFSWHVAHAALSPPSSKPTTPEGAAPRSGEAT